jgi:hypothetical protein
LNLWITLFDLEKGEAPSRQMPSRSPPSDKLIGVPPSV